MIPAFGRTQEHTARVLISAAGEAEGWSRRGGSDLQGALSSVTSA